MIDVRIKSLFFDRPKVVRAVDRAKRNSLARAGGLVRQTARRSIRKRKSISRPGQPPHSHEGGLRRGILFGYDPGSESVVVGPLGFRSSEVPSVLEFGGTTTVLRRRGGRLVREKIRVARRPYMGPALEKTRSRLPKVWRNSVRGA